MPLLSSPHLTYHSVGSEIKDQEDAGTLLSVPTEERYPSRRKIFNVRLRPTPEIFLGFGLAGLATTLKASYQNRSRI
jgi:hypothetical protein